ncbi:energy transducer TonB [Vulgatibacter sp.]|uniref:energy transducer TonB n=1 Tax=Vulgatibacter sp. TaxID=1971226 RepID=UPI003567AE5B
MKSFSRALAVSAVVHGAAIGLFSLLPTPPTPARVERIELQLVELPAGGGGGDAAAGGGAAPGAGAVPAGEDGGAPGKAALQQTAQPARAVRAAERPDRQRPAAVVRAPADEAVAAPQRADAEVAVAEKADVVATPTPTMQPSAPEAESEQESTAAAAHVDTEPRDAPFDTAGEASASEGTADEGTGTAAAFAARGGGEGSGAGRGGGTGAGTGKGAGPAAGDASLLERLRWQTERCYPRAARRRRTEGTVDVRFCVDATGAPDLVTVERSSGSRLLDDAATRCVIAGSAPYPARDRCVQVAIDFHLR